MVAFTFRYDGDLSDMNHSKGLCFPNQKMSVIFYDEIQSEYQRPDVVLIS